MKIIKKYSTKTMWSILWASLVPISFIIASNLYLTYYLIIEEFSHDANKSYELFKWLLSSQFKVFIISILITSVFAMIIGNRATKPVKRLTKRVSKLREDFENEEKKKKLLPESGYEEFKYLSVTINDLVKSILEFKKENKELYTSSITDPLTKLNNKRFLLDHLSSLFETNPEKISMIFFDIDKFKSVNDTFGHHIGDEILKGVAEIIREEAYNTFKEKATVARFGGEEIVIMFEGCNPNEIEEFGERVRLAICGAKHLSDFVEGRVISVSSGIAHYPSDAKNQEELLEKSDEAMYYSKNNGRNRCTTYSKMN